jgi:hypothetical protein
LDSHLFLSNEVQLQGDEWLQLPQNWSQEGLTVNSVTAARHKLFSVGLKYFFNKIFRN